MLASGPYAKGNDGQPGPGSGTVGLTCAFVVERVTRIELALSAWELDRSCPVMSLTSQVDLP